MPHRTAGTIDCVEELTGIHESCTIHESSSACRFALYRSMLLRNVYAFFPQALYVRNILRIVLTAAVVATTTILLLLLLLLLLQGVLVVVVVVVVVVVLVLVISGGDWW